MSSYDPLNPTTEGRHCPMYRGKCPGTHKGCTFWRTQAVEIQGKDTLIQNCMFVLQFEEQYQNVGENIRIQAAIQHLNNQIFASVQALQRGEAVPRLSGNHEKDVKMLVGGNGS